MTKQNRHLDVWRRAFFDALHEISPIFAGRIDWDTANHFMYTGMQPGVAAVRYAESALDKRVSTQSAWDITHNRKEQ